MKKTLKICECKRAYINPLSGICTLCWNEIYPNEQYDVEEDDLLETKEEKITVLTIQIKNGPTNPPTIFTSISEAIEYMKNYENK